MIIIKYIVHRNLHIAMLSWTTIVNIVIIRTSIFQTFPKNLFTIKDEDPCKKKIFFPYSIEKCNWMSVPSFQMTLKITWLRMLNYQSPPTVLPWTHFTQMIKFHPSKDWLHLYTTCQICPALRGIIRCVLIFLGITKCPSTLWTNFKLYHLW